MNTIFNCLVHWLAWTFILVVLNFKGTVSHYCMSGNFSERENPEIRLRRCLHLTFEKGVSPRGASDEGMVVQLKFFFINVMDVDDKSKTMTLQFSLDTSWRDHRLTWSPEIFGDIVEITVAARNIWTPNFMIRNNIFQRKGQYENTVRIPYSLGQSIHWTRQIMSQTYCEFTYVRYPFDSITCRVNIEHIIIEDNPLIVTSDLAYSKIMNSETGVPHMCQMLDPEWSISDCSLEEVEEVKRPGYINYFNIELKMSRNYQFHLYIIIYPSIILSIIIITILWIPHHSKQRLVTGGGLFFTILFLTSLIHRFMPIGIDQITCLVAYMLYLMLLLCTCLFLSFFTERIYSKKDGYVPDFFQKVFFNRPVSFITGVSLPPPSTQGSSSMFNFDPYPSSPSSSPSVPPPPPPSSSSPAIKRMEKLLSEIRQNLTGLMSGEHLAASDDQWRSLALMVDRLAFEVLMVVNVAVTWVIYTKW